LQQAVYKASANLGDAVPDVRQTFSDAADSWVDLAADLRAPDYDLGSGKFIHLETRTLAYPADAANAAADTIPSVSASTSNYELGDARRSALHPVNRISNRCTSSQDLGEAGSETDELTSNFLDTMRDIPQSVTIFVRLYVPDPECGLVGGLPAL
jgi:hypothetical protein